MTVTVVALLFLFRLFSVLLPSPSLPITIRAGYPGTLVSLCEKTGPHFPKAHSLGHQASASLSREG